MPDVEPINCGTFHAGHMTHWIQAKLSRENRDHPPIGVRGIAIDGFEVRLDLADGTVREVWMHDTVRLAGLLGRSAALRSHHVLAMTGRKDSQILLSVGTVPSPCPLARAVETPVRWPAEEDPARTTRRGGA